jgi:hypothetical protein
MQRRKRVKTTELNVRLEPRLKEAAMKASALEHRTLSNLVELLLIEHCTKVGTLKQKR